LWPHLSGGFLRLATILATISKSHGVLVKRGRDRIPSSWVAIAVARTVVVASLPALARTASDSEGIDRSVPK
jgi:hypothetical protein